MKLEVIIEKGDGVLFGRIEGHKDYLPVTCADSLPEVLFNLRTLIKDHQKHEGKNDSFWKKVDAYKIRFDILYDVQAFFSEHEYLTASAVADKAGLNRGLVRQYKCGTKYPSLTQAKKIEAAIKQISAELNKIALYA